MYVTAKIQADAISRGQEEYLKHCGGINGTAIIC